MLLRKRGKLLLGSRGLTSLPHLQSSLQERVCVCVSDFSGPPRRGLV